jgi:hypothetical protein
MPESFFEHRQSFSDGWIERWTIPNPFLVALASPLRTMGAELSDFSFNKEATNIAENYLNIALRKFNAGVRIGLDSVTFMASNPDWELAPKLIGLFDEISDLIHRVVEVSPKYQEAILAFHVTAGKLDFGVSTASLVNKKKIGEGLFYGVSVYGGDRSLVIDKSARYEGGAFVRVQRKFAGEIPLAKVAEALYNEEVTALRLLGIADIP